MKIELQRPFLVAVRWLIDGVPQWIEPDDSEVGFVYGSKNYVTTCFSNEGCKSRTIRIFEYDENVESFPKDGLHAAWELRKKGLGGLPWETPIQCRASV